MKVVSLISCNSQQESFFVFPELSNFSFTVNLLSTSDFSASFFSHDSSISTSFPHLYLSSCLAPCPPTNVSARMNCTTHKALVSWSTAAAATAYSVQATSINGHSSSCSGMGTYCNLNNLVCGQEYSVVVDAMNTGCPGPASAPARLATGEYNSNRALLILLKILLKYSFPLLSPLSSFRQKIKILIHNVDDSITFCVSLFQLSSEATVCCLQWIISI